MRKVVILIAVMASVLFVGLSYAKAPLKHGYMVRKYLGDGQVIATILGFETTSPLPAAHQNSAYAQDIIAKDATGNTVTITLNSGSSLPAGLSITNTDAVNKKITISGTPTTSGTTSFTLLATNNNGKTATKTYSLTVNAEAEDNIPETFNSADFGTTNNAIANTKIVSSVSVDLDYINVPVNVTVYQDSNPGEYTVNSTNAANCVASGSVQVHEHDVIRLCANTGAYSTAHAVTAQVGGSQSKTWHVNTAGATPTISGLPTTLKVQSAVASQTLPFTINDADTAVADLVVSATAQNNNWGSAPTLTITGVNPYKTLTITAPAGATNGTTADVVVSVSDGATSATHTITATVDNQAPTITGLPETVSVSPNVATALTFTIGDDATPVASLVVDAVISDATWTKAITGTNPSKTLTITAPASAVNGATATITVSVNDGALTTTKSVVAKVVVPILSTFGDWGSGDKGCGGVLAPNGKIYGIPQSAATVLEIDPINKTISTFGSLGTAASKWSGGVLAPNGKIYGIPSGATTVLEIDPINRTATTFGNLSGFSGMYKWSGGVLATNGKIYAIPAWSSVVLEIDPDTHTITSFGNLGTSDDKWSGGILASNGKIYAMPNRASKILEIDPINKTAVGFASTLSGDYKYASAILASNGKIYGIPMSATTVLEVDPINGTIKTFGNLSSTTFKWIGGVLASNGKIYGIPRGISSVLEIDPVAGTATTFGNLGTSYWRGGALAPNGKIYGIPATSTTVLEIDLGLPAATIDPLSPYYNKL